MSPETIFHAVRLKIGHQGCMKIFKTMCHRRGNSVVSILYILIRCCEKFQQILTIRSILFTSDRVHLTEGPTVLLQLCCFESIPLL